MRAARLLPLITALAALCALPGAGAQTFATEVIFQRFDEAPCPLGMKAGPRTNAYIGPCSPPFAFEGQALHRSGNFTSDDKFVLTYYTDSACTNIVAGPITITKGQCTTLDVGAPVNAKQVGIYTWNDYVPEANPFGGSARNTPAFTSLWLFASALLMALLHPLF